MHFLTEEDLRTFGEGQVTKHAHSHRGGVRTFCEGQVSKHALSHRGGLKDFLQGTGN